MNEASNTLTVHEAKSKDWRFIHGHAIKHHHTKEYRAWHGAKCRCYNPKMTGYENYGERGICVCEGFKIFKNFIDIMGPAPSSKHSLDRIDNEKHYSCGKCSQCIKEGWKLNCRWATKLEQDNNRSICVFYTLNGESMTIPQWARRYHLKVQTVEKRFYRLKWTLEKALITPVRKPKNFTFMGESHPLAVWSKRYGVVGQEVLRCRLRAGWDFITAATQPLVPVGAKLHTVRFPAS